MIRSEIVEINGAQFEHLWSDAHRQLTRNGQAWDEVYNPLNTGRVYEEGDLIVDDEDSAEAILDVILGGIDD